MTPLQVEVRDLPAWFAQLLALAAAGAVVIVTDRNLARARLLPLEGGTGRVAGLHPGGTQTADEFDAPLPEAFWAGQP
jgi:antitoxin (DNA-binding transcriptional repressor) of toxin-antitoxin stability system